MKMHQSGFGARVAGWRATVAIGGAAVLAVLATALHLAAERELDFRSPFTFFYLAVLVSTLLWGWVAGAVTAGAGAIFGSIFVLQPRGLMPWGDPVEVTELILFICTSVFMVVLVESLRRARARANEAAQHATDAAERLRQEAAIRERAEQDLARHRDHLSDLVRERSAALEATYERLRTSERMAAVGSLAAGLAHDMTNVLMPLSARLDAVMSASGLAGEARTDLTVVIALLDHLKSMARNLSLFAQDPRREGIEGRTDLARWCGQVKGFIDASTGPGVVVRWDVPEGLPPVGVAPHRLTQVVQNLVHNARDAIAAARGPDARGGESGRIVVTARAGEAGAGGAGLVTVKVTDDGCGMNEEIRRRCTEPFFTTKDRPSIAGAAGGTGIGLSIAYTIIQRAGGEMQIESEVGQGTTVTVVLPVAPPDVAASPVGLARISIKDTRTRAIVVNLLRSLQYEAHDGDPEPNSTSVLWVTDGMDAKPEQAAVFLRLRPGQRVVTLGGDESWRAVGATVCEPKVAVAELRNALAGGMP